MTYYGSIPFLDLVTPHKELEEELVDVFREALRTAHFIGGVAVEKFEQAFASFCATDYCVGVGSGTDALRFALMAAGINAGDLVVTTSNTFIATTEAISQAGAQPVFVDINENTHSMDPLKLQQYLEVECHFQPGSHKLVENATNRPVTAVVPVHLYGQTADMDPILEIAQRYGLKVIEDACQAHGAGYYSERDKKWRKAGSMGAAAAFSFYPGKNLGACGEAGAVTTNDESMAKKIRMLRDHGQSRKYYHDLEGYNGRLDAIQAGILSAKLKHLSSWNGKRRELAENYRRLLKNTRTENMLLQEPSWSRAVYHLFVIRVQDRTQLQAYLGEANIATAIHYPVPLHLQKAYQSTSYKAGDLPVTELVASEILSLPMYPQLNIEQQECVTERIKQFFSKQPQRSISDVATVA